MPSRSFLHAVLLGGYILASASVPSTPSSSEAAQEPFAMVFEAIYEKAEGPGGGAFNPLVVVGEEAKLPASPTAFGLPLKVISRGEARQAQLAWFLSVSKVEESENEIVVTYEKPYSAYFGKVRLAREGGAWKVASHDKYHSSSGGRFFYGKLYEGVTCRDGSEMSKRWNGYVDAVAAMQEKRPRKELEQLPEKCPGSVFPDVAAYEQAKKMGMIK